MKKFRFLYIAAAALLFAACANEEVQFRHTPDIVLLLYQAR